MLGPVLLLVVKREYKHTFRTRACHFRNYEERKGFYLKIELLLASDLADAKKLHTFSAKSLTSEASFFFTVVRTLPQLFAARTQVTEQVIRNALY